MLWLNCSSSPSPKLKEFPFSMSPEYKNLEEEIRDGWVGTGLGALCVILIGLVVRELAFYPAYVGDGQLGWKATKVGISIAFAVCLFFVKDAKNYDRLEKIRFYLFSLLFFIIFALWMVPYSNRVFPGSLPRESVKATIVRAIPRHRIRIGKSDERAYDYVELSLEIPYKATKGTNEVAGKDRAAQKRYALVWQQNYKPSEQTAGSTINVWIYHGRWGQDFILGE